MAAPLIQGSKPSALKLFQYLNHLRHGKCRAFEGMLLPSDVICGEISSRSLLNMTTCYLSSRVSSASVNVKFHSVAGDLHIHRPSADTNTPNNINFGTRRWISQKSHRRSSTHYYDVLGLTPKASQKQIKSAYYEMSKIHHPDVTASSTPGSAGKSHSVFTEISEAYEVLGNIRKRRMYDKGAFNPRDRRVDDTSAADEDYTQAYRQGSNFERGNRPPPPRGRTNIYNFDEFYKQHYNDIRERKANEWREYAKYKSRMEEHGHGQLSKIPVSLVITAWMLLLFTIVIMRENNDNDLIGKSRKSHQANNRFNNSLENIPEPVSNNR